MSEFRFTNDQWRVYQDLPEQGISHRHWLEHVVNSWLAKRDRQVAEKTWDRCIGEMPIDPDWKNFYTDNNPYRKERNDDC